MLQSTNVTTNSERRPAHNPTPQNESDRRSASTLSQAEPTNADEAVDVLLIGHVTRDLVGQAPDSDYRIGGTVSFGAVTALRLGRRPTILTSAESEADLAELPADIQRYVLPADATSTFANVYHDDGRVQYLYARAAPITLETVTAKMQGANAVLLGPLTNEVQPEIASSFAPETLVAAVPQGWMRRWDETGRIYSIPWQSEAQILPYLGALILSEEDIDYDLSRLENAFRRVPLVVITEYRDGSTVYQQRPDGSIDETKIPPRPANEVDPTGAGDVFATAFMLRYQETGDAIQSARFANITASYGVEADGVTGIPSRGRVLRYMEENPFG